MTAEPAAKLTTQDYLAHERQADYKSEFLNGELLAMAGASRWHNIIVLNVGSELRIQLKGRRCETYSTNMRVHIPPTGLYTYPDVVVICGTPEFDDDQHDTLLNPTVLIEVLSPSTERYDRGAKFGHYRRLASLREYVLISQEKPLIERYVRHEDSRFWLLSDAEGLDAKIEVSSVGCVLALAEVYDKVHFEEMEQEE